MTARRPRAFARLFAPLALLIAFFACLPAVAYETKPFEDHDPKLDVDFTPTPMDAVRRMLDMAGVGPDDYVVDLGSGDGRILLTAATEYGVERALGVDIDPWLVDYAADKATAAGVAQRVRFVQGDLFETDFFDADVLTMYLLPELNLRLRPLILSQMKPGTRIVSHSFDMGEWTPDAKDHVHLRDVYLWIVPARVGGRWRLEREGLAPVDLEFEQRFQRVTASASANGQALDTGAVELDGAEISFRLDGRRYHGHVDTDTIRPLEGADWSARRLRR